jgi:hypothetical protein
MLIVKKTDKITKMIPTINKAIPMPTINELELESAVLKLIDKIIKPNTRIANINKLLLSKAIVK